MAILRTDHVFGPEDELIAPLLRKIRALPVVPVPDGDREFQPLWHEDLERITAAVAARTDLSRQTLDAFGPEITTMNEIFDRLCEITGRSPARVPAPGASVTHLKREHTNAIELLGIETTPRDHALRLLANSLPEVLPEEGIGALEHKKVWADIRGSRFSAAALMMQFRERFNEFMPLDFAAEPGAPHRIEQGVTLTGSLPLRGHFQVRVEVAEPKHVVFVTVEGHPLAGMVEFTTSEEDGAVRFAIDTYTRASNIIDFVAARTLGAFAQSKNWRLVVETIITASGGTSDGVKESAEKLAKEDARRVEKRVKAIVERRLSPPHSQMP